MINNIHPNVSTFLAVSTNNVTLAVTLRYAPEGVPGPLRVLLPPHIAQDVRIIQEALQIILVIAH